MSVYTGCTCTPMTAKFMSPLQPTTPDQRRMEKQWLQICLRETRSLSVWIGASRRPQHTQDAFDHVQELGTLFRKLIHIYFSLHSEDAKQQTPVFNYYLNMCSICPSDVADTSGHCSRTVLYHTRPETHYCVLCTVWGHSETLCMNTFLSNFSGCISVFCDPKQWAYESQGKIFVFLFQLHVIWITEYVAKVPNVSLD